MRVRSALSGVETRLISCIVFKIEVGTDILGAAFRIKFVDDVC
jgi:hypothetical protein